MSRTLLIVAAMAAGVLSLDSNSPAADNNAKATLRIVAPETAAPGRVYLVKVESRAEAGKNWRYADPDTFQVTLTGLGTIVTDPSLKPMNPFTLSIPADAKGSVTLTASGANGASGSQVVAIGPPPPAETFAATINPAKTTHRFDGLGAGVLFYDNQFDITPTGEIYDWCFADVKTSFLHILIRPDCEPENDGGDWRKVDLEKFDFKSAARVLRIAREALKRNPGLQIYTSVYSPPPWMKTNNKTSGEGTLKEGLEYRRALAKYVFAWIKHAQAEGVPVHYLAFFNEPDWPHSQDGMLMKDFSLLADTFADCAAALDELVAADKNLTIKPKQVFPDSLGSGSITRGGAGTEKLKARAGKLARVDVWGVHDYWNTGGDYWANRYRELRAFPGVGSKPIWMTEWAQRFRHGDLDSAMEYGRNMLNALRLGAGAWMAFEWMHPYGSQSGLISTDWGEQTGKRRYWRSKAYYMFRQIANTTPPGSEIVEMSKESGASLEYLALRQGQHLVVHLLNPGSNSVHACLMLQKRAMSSPECRQTTPFQNGEAIPRDRPSELTWMPLPAEKSSSSSTSGTITLPPYSLTTLRF